MDAMYTATCLTNINIFCVNKNLTKTQVIANSDSLIKRNDLNKIKKILKILKKHKK